MANRFWVGGSGTWNSLSSAHWSATSGGAGGASVPTSADAAFINGSSGGGTVTFAGGDCASLDFTGFAGTFSCSSGTLNIYGNLTLSSSMTFTGANSTILF